MDQEVPIGSLLHLKSSRFHKWNDLETPMVVDNPIGPRGTIFATGPGSLESSLESQSIGYITSLIFIPLIYCSGDFGPRWLSPPPHQSIPSRKALLINYNHGPLLLYIPFKQMN